MRTSIGAHGTWAVILFTLAAGCSGKPVTPAARTLTPEYRAALTDTISALSDSIIKAGERRDATAMTARFLDGPEAAFGGAGGLVLSAEQLRFNVSAGYKTIRSQQMETMEQRVAILSSDAAVTTGWGNFTAVDTTGATARGKQAFTFAWARHEGVWRVIQAHFSSQLVSLEAPPGRTARPPARDSTRRR
jgi:uncharacterized protein (TIGR02246 family)